MRIAMPFGKWWPMMGAIPGQEGRRTRIGVMVLALVLLALGLLALYSDEEITIQPPLAPPALARPCLMAYGDNVSYEDQSRAYISVYVGKAANAEEAVDKVRANRRILARRFTSELKKSPPSFFVGWSQRIFVRYRTKGDGYARRGWYIRALDHSGGLEGGYFLSDGGWLMPAVQQCAHPLCCI